MGADRQDSFDDQFAEVVHILAKGALRLATEHAQDVPKPAEQEPQDLLAPARAESVHGASG